MVVPGEVFCCNTNSGVEFVLVDVGVLTVALVLIRDGEAVATALPLLSFAPTTNSVWLLLLRTSPSDDMTAALLVLPAPLELDDELELAIARYSVCLGMARILLEFFLLAVLECERAKPM